MLVNKFDFRKQAIDTLKCIDPQHKKKLEQQLLHHLLKTDVWKRAQTIGISIALAYEWDTEPIIRTAWAEGKRVAVPKCYPEERKMSFYKMTSYDALENVFGALQEPNPHQAELIQKSQIDLLIVPGLYFDMLGYRIGFGGGYYDRYLENFQGSTLSLMSEALVVPQLPRDDFDIPVHHLITENGLIK